MAFMPGVQFKIRSAGIVEPHEVQASRSGKEQLRQKLFSDKEAANYLGVAASTMRNWRYTGTGPTYGRVGRLIKYRKEDLDEYYEHSMVKFKEPLPRSKG